MQQSIWERISDSITRPSATEKLLRVSEKPEGETRQMLEYAEDLIKLQGADVNARSVLGLTPLHKAAIWGKAALCRVLLANGANPNIEDRWGNIPLHEAAHRKHRKIARLLLDHGSDPEHFGQGDVRPRDYRVVQEVLADMHNEKTAATALRRSTKGGRPEAHHQPSVSAEEMSAQGRAGAFTSRIITDIADSSGIRAER
jgi:ankyrin repeat protein